MPRYRGVGEPDGPAPDARPDGEVAFGFDGRSERVQLRAVCGDLSDLEHEIRPDPGHRPDHRNREDDPRDSDR